jgi:hypothetical protein
MRTFLCLLAVALATAGLPVRSQTASASITGVIVSDATAPTPVRGVTLTLQGTGLSTPRLAISDADGRFTFFDVPAGSLTLISFRPGDVTMNKGAVRTRR